MDLGTANTIIISDDKIVVDEPSVVALDRHTDKMIAVGSQAKMMYEKTHDNIRTVRPLRDGVIADFSACEQMMRGLIKMVHTGSRLFSMASLVNALTPVAVTILAALILKEKITPVKILCLILALAGTFIITKGASTRSETTGVIIVLLGMTGFAAASVFMRRLTAKYPPVFVTAVSMTISVVLNIPVMIWCFTTQSFHVTPEALAALLFLGFAGSGLAQMTWTAALAILPASTCSLFYPLQPLFSAILGALLLHETFSPTFFVGLLLISLDVILNTLETKRQVGNK